MVSEKMCAGEGCSARPGHLNDAGLCARCASPPSEVRNVRMVLAEENPDALWPDGFDEAFLGPARRCGQPALAAFSVKKCVKILMKRDGMSYEEAVEFFDFNVSGAWCGPGTPIWIYDDSDDDA